MTGADMLAALGFTALGIFFWRWNRRIIARTRRPPIWEANLRQRQIDREVNESRSIRWRR
jgi:hypothetical protein